MPRTTEEMLLEAREVLRIVRSPDFDPREFPHTLTRRLVQSVEDLAAENGRLRESLQDELDNWNPERRPSLEAENRRLRRAIRDYVLAIGRAPGNRDEVEVEAASRALCAAVSEDGRVRGGEEGPDPVAVAVGANSPGSIRPVPSALGTIVGPHVVEGDGRWRIVADGGERLVADGTLVHRDEFPELFGVVGFAYGRLPWWRRLFDGEARGAFRLPDLTARIVR